MKITTTDNYRHKECDFDFCQRRYCHKHRLLWRECETIKQGVDDYYLGGEPHYVYEAGSCPSCEYESRKRRDDLERMDWEAWSAAQRLAEAKATEQAIEYWQEDRGSRGKRNYKDI